MRMACDSLFGGDLIFQWQRRFPETVSRLRCAGLLYETADRIADDYAQALITISQLGPVSQQALDSMLDKAFQTEPPIPTLRPIPTGVRRI